jgi:CheY-like chemotaxis protein
MSSSPTFRSEGAERPRVLVVDDDRLGTEVRSELIRMSGCSVDVAFSGTEALAKASSCNFDIFVIDYDMPGMNGLKLARELRRQGHWAPIAMLSGRLELPSEPGAELLARFISKGEGAHVLLRAVLDLSPQAPPTESVTTRCSTAKVGTN